MNTQELLDLISDRLTATSTDKKTSIIATIRDLLELGGTPCDGTDLNLIQQTVREIKKSHDVFYPYRDQKKVCIFGSARTKPENPNFQIAEELARRLNEKDFHIVTGAGPGIMEAGNKGAKPEQNFGLNIELPYEQEANPYILGSDKLVSYKYFFTRKLYFVKESHACVMLPGGFGTHDESFELLTLIQTGRCAPRPLVYITHDDSDYWDKWNTYIMNQLLKRGYISDKDIHLYTLTNSIDECIQNIEDFYFCYDSLRYIDHHAIMRVSPDISHSTIKYLKAEFKDLIKGDSLQLKDVNDVPEDNHVHLDKKRLVFKFGKVNYGGLTHFIKRLNYLEKHRR